VGQWPESTMPCDVEAGRLVSDAVDNGVNRNEEEEQKPGPNCSQLLDRHLPDLGSRALIGCCWPKRRSINTISSPTILLPAGRAACVLDSEVSK